MTNQGSYRKLLIGSAAVALGMTSIALAQPGGDGPPLSRVSYTSARELQSAKRIDLPGTVEAPKSSRVAAEVEGVVTRVHAREGQHVKQGAPLVGLSTEHIELELERAQGDLREAEARLALAKASLDRSERLQSEGVLSRQQADDARYEYQAWQGRADRLEAEIRRLSLDLDRATVDAPFSGVVVAENVELGEWVAKGATVMELVAPYVLEVRVDVPESYFGSIRPGGNASVRFESLPGLEVEGKVVSLVPRANASSRTFPMKIRVDNETAQIGVGMLAKVSIRAGEQRARTIVPKDAVITRGDNRFVYRIEEESQGYTVALVPVQTGNGVGEWIEVEGPLETTAKVVVRGNERLRPGQGVLAEAIEYPAP